MAKSISALVYAGLNNSSPDPNPVTITPAKCYTKTAYAKYIGKTPTWVNELIKQGKVAEVAINGGSFVMEK